MFRKRRRENGENSTWFSRHRRDRWYSSQVKAEVHEQVSAIGAPLCRSIFLCKPPQIMLDASQALLADLNSHLAAARVGNRACDVANALVGELVKVGIDRGGRYGYPIGVDYPSDWGERTVLIRPADETVLQPDMTCHFTFCRASGWMAEAWRQRNPSSSQRTAQRKSCAMSREGSSLAEHRLNGQGADQQQCLASSHA